jgi:hypothetical protein
MSTHIIRRHTLLVNLLIPIGKYVPELHAILQRDLIYTTYIVIDELFKDTLTHVRPNGRTVDEEKLRATASAVLTHVRPNGRTVDEEKFRGTASAVLTHVRPNGRTVDEEKLRGTASTFASYHKMPQSGWVTSKQKLNA